MPEEELRIGLADEERAWLDDFDFLDQAEANWTRELTREQFDQWEAARALQDDLEGRTLVLRAHRVDHPLATARFLAYVEEPPAATDRPDHRIRIGNVWYLSGYLGRTSSGDERVTHLAIESPAALRIGLTSETLRAISTSELLAKVQMFLRANETLDELVAAWDLPNADELQDLRQTALAARRMELRRGSGGFPGSYYRGLAWDYLEQKKRGRGVLQRLARLYDREQRTIRDHLHRAKLRHFLEGGTQGQLSYKPGPNLYKKEGDR